MGRHSKPDTPVECVLYTCVTDRYHVRITHDGSVWDYHVSELGLPRQPFVGYRGIVFLRP